VIEFAVPHTLAFTFFPHWLMDLRGRFGQVKTRLLAMNVHDAVLRFSEAGCDLLIAYHHASTPLQLSPARYEMLSLGQETLAAFAKADASGQPLFKLVGGSGPVPLLAYAAGAYMGHMVEQIIRQLSAAPVLEITYETDMAEGLKAMALEGHGLAFLPTSSVRNELRSRRLVAAAPPGVAELTMEVRLYRERPELARISKPAAQALWDFLRQQA
jgi:DNA-binding transcriptional LysR family regulator